MKNNNKGFSLIELSIVLIIMGLLVAGITGGASLIKSAELRSFMNELRNYQTAVNAYYTSVGNLPGATTNQIAFSDSCKAWGLMAKEGTVDVNMADDCTFAANDTLGTADKSPAAKLKGAFYAIGYNNDVADNVIFVGASDEKPGDLTTVKMDASDSKAAKPTMTIKDTKLVDTKMDNGKETTGNIRAFSSSTTNTCDYDSTTDSNKYCTVSYSIAL